MIAKQAAHIRVMNTKCAIAPYAKTVTVTIVLTVKIVQVKNAIYVKIVMVNHAENVPVYRVPPVIVSYA